MVKIEKRKCGETELIGFVKVKTYCEITCPLHMLKLPRLKDNFFFLLQVEQVLHVERLRQAILENIHVDFAKPLLPSALYPPYPPYGPGPGPYGPGPIPRGRGGPLGAMMGPPGPKSPGRGRGILGNAGNNLFCY